TLTIEETWQRAYLTQQFYGKQAAISLFQTVLARSPHHPYANYHLGKILVEQEDWTGIQYLEEAMAHHPNLVISCAELLYEVYQSRQHHHKAMMYRQRRQQHQALWAITKIERDTLQLSDRFGHHNLPSDECQQLAETLARCGEVRIAYLVQKVLNIATDPPLHVLGILRGEGFGNRVHDLDDVAFSGWLKAGLCFSGDLKVVVFKHPSVPLCQAIRRVDHALLYIHS
ncbi:MAG: tetratricopeptide repeat protein, partial [Merismopedia sp. SIO2A8]|nr:tetratricopeptide repeat protein [Merismopedia sp. SIO2A8]